MCVCVAFFALTLCYILLSFSFYSIYGVYTRECSCIYMYIPPLNDSQMHSTKFGWCKSKPSPPHPLLHAHRLAPLKHRQDISDAVRDFSVSGLSLSQEADSKPTSVYYGVGNEDNAGILGVPVCVRVRACVVTFEA